MVQAFVLTTFFILGFGYFVTSTSLQRPIAWPGPAWLGFWTMLAGTVAAALSFVSDQRRERARVWKSSVVADRGAPRTKTGSRIKRRTPGT